MRSSSTKLVSFHGNLQLYRQLFGLLALPYLLLGWWTPGRFLARVRPPGARRPVRLRLGSSDLWTFRGVFMRNFHKIGMNPPPRVIVDVGGNTGLTAVYFARRFREARVLVLEPEPANFALLRRNVSRYRRIEPVQAALWRANEPLAFSNPIGDFDSFRVGAPGADGADGAPGPVSSPSVDGKTLDRFMDEHGIDRIDLLKVDIEGAEREVFADASAWIDRVDVLVVEVHDFLMPGCESTVRAALRDFECVEVRRRHLIAARHRDRITKLPGVRSRESPSAQAPASGSA